MRDRPALAQQASLGLIRAHIGRPILYLPRRGSDFRPRRVFGMCRCAVILLRPHNPAESGRPRELALLNFCLSALGAQFKCWMCPRICYFMLHGSCLLVPLAFSRISIKMCRVFANRCCIRRNTYLRLLSLMDRVVH